MNIALGVGWIVVICAGVGLVQGDYGLAADIIGILIIAVCCLSVVGVLIMAAIGNNMDNEGPTLRASSTLEWPDRPGSHFNQAVIDETEWHDHGH